MHCTVLYKSFIRTHVNVILASFLPDQAVDLMSQKEIDETDVIFRKPYLARVKLTNEAGPQNCRRVNMTDPIAITRKVQFALQHPHKVLIPPGEDYWDFAQVKVKHGFVVT